MCNLRQQREILVVHRVEAADQLTPGCRDEPGLFRGTRCRHRGLKSGREAHDTTVVRKMLHHWLGDLEAGGRGPKPRPQAPVEAREGEETHSPPGPPGGAAPRTPR